MTGGGRGGGRLPTVQFFMRDVHEKGCVEGEEGEGGVPMFCMPLLLDHREGGREGKSHERMDPFKLLHGIKLEWELATNAKEEDVPCALRHSTHSLEHTHTNTCIGA